ncbi:hypothetical protein DL89DRAFT_268799 [Linderina pennispora]|uniref:Kinetochore protein NDC80 n=1 Tax=Linderina pennispora TaxID=61395 RepID=A0A1Y1W416_9FUNG|nr:uncharacterized protein DL89DRAFT_268799 [Linderina pennispora]ORX68289.1 hypothetical protein DL89DRAFT_268799 [Linderina pennispora]
MRNGGGVKDPRPVKDRSFQSKAQQTIMLYLSTHAYPGLLTPKTLVAPTVKDFQTNLQVPVHEAGSKVQVREKFEDDALQILRGVKYPKSQLFSAGSMSAWPILLAMLLWLVELIECVDMMEQREESMVDDGAKESKPIYRPGAAQFELKNEHLTQEAKDVEDQLQIARAELKALRESESPLRQLERRRVEQIGDVSRNTEKLEASQVEKLALEKEIAEVRLTVDAQQISTEDVDRMTAERNQLQSVMDGVQEKIREASDDVNDKGMRLQRVLDTVDEHVQDYAAKAYRAWIELAVDKNANDKSKVTSRACDTLTSQWHATETAVIRLREERDQLADLRMELEVRVEEMDKQVARHNTEYQELRRINMMETQTSAKQIEQLEGRIQSLQSDISKGQLQSEAAISHAEAERNSVLLGCRMRRNEIDEDVVATLENAAQMKKHTEEKLKELLQLVIEEQEAS